MLITMPFLNRSEVTLFFRSSYQVHLTVRALPKLLLKSIAVLPLAVLAGEFHSVFLVARVTKKKPSLDLRYLSFLLMWTYA